MSFLNPTTRRRLTKFQSNKRAYYSFIVILLTYIISLFAPLIANDTPLLIKYNGSFYFPNYFMNPIPI